ncbi:MAG: hypothetical protein GKR94_15810 [Gammaproteobacteria bacterium]|nr:hypothetical protein [Gammaproteobacteria bacterium]
MTGKLSRLRALREESGMAATKNTELFTGMDERRTVSARLQQFAITRKRSPAGARMSAAQLCHQLEGRLVAAGVIYAAHHLPQPVSVGQAVIDEAALGAVAYLLGAARMPRRLVVIDTETTGLAGGTGTVAFVIGALELAARELRLHQWVLTRFQGEQAALEALAEVLQRCDAIVSYNGASYDLPLLETRFRLAGLPLRFCETTHLDLLPRVRRAFAGRWPDCKLQRAEQKLLSRVRADDLPGAEVPIQWFNWMRYGDGSGMRAVVRHNRDDVLGLAALLAPLARVYADPGTYGARVAAVLRDRVDEGELYAALRRFRVQLDDTDTLELARLAKRAGAWFHAEAALTTLAEQGHAVAAEQLAKLYEHQLKQLPRALELTRMLLRRAPYMPGLKRREDRVLRKLAAAAAPHRCAGQLV